MPGRRRPAFRPGRGSRCRSRVRPRAPWRPAPRPAAGGMNPRRGLIRRRAPPGMAAGPLAASGSGPYGQGDQRRPCGTDGRLSLRGFGLCLVFRAGRSGGWAYGALGNPGARQGPPAARPPSGLYPYSTVARETTGATAVSPGWRAPHLQRIGWFHALLVPADGQVRVGHAGAILLRMPPTRPGSPPPWHGPAGDRHVVAPRPGDRAGRGGGDAQGAASGAPCPHPARRRRGGRRHGRRRWLSGAPAAAAPGPARGRTHAWPVPPPPPRPGLGLADRRNGLGRLGLSLAAALFLPTPPTLQHFPTGRCLRLPPIGGLCRNTRGACHAAPPWPRRRAYAPTTGTRWPPRSARSPPGPARDPGPRRWRRTGLGPGAFSHASSAGPWAAGCATLAAVTRISSFSANGAIRHQVRGSATYRSCELTSSGKPLAFDDRSGMSAR